MPYSLLEVAVLLVRVLEELDQREIPPVLESAVLLVRVLEELR